jgi:hypothetical protein
MDKPVLDPEMVARHDRACHAMQTAVALDHERGSKDGTPKHLRVGVNSALCDLAALARLLIEKGVITWDEYQKAMTEEMEREVQRYRERLNLPDNVHLA